MKYFEIFAASLSTCHAEYLLRSISSKSQPLVQSRLKGENHFSQVCPHHFFVHPNMKHDFITSIFKFHQLNTLERRVFENNFNYVFTRSFNRRKSISEMDIVLTPQSRIIWLQNKSAVLIVSPSVEPSDEESLRKLLSCTDTVYEAFLSRFVMQNFRLLLKTTTPLERR
jgi:hypothetical protein